MNLLRVWVLPLGLTCFFFFGCHETSKQDAGAQASAYSALQILCPDSSGLSAPERTVCGLYDAFPPKRDTEENRKIDGNFLRYFDKELADSLAKLETVDNVLYDADFHQITGFRIVGFDSAESSVRVGFKNYGKPQTLVYTLKNTSDGWRVSEIRYALGYSLRENLGGKPLDTLAAMDGFPAKYWEVRDNYFLDMGKENSDTFQKLPEASQRELKNGQLQAAWYLNARAEAIAGPVDLEGFSKSHGNNLMNCDADQCANLDGMLLNSEKDSVSLIISTTASLKRFAADYKIPAGLNEISKNEDFYTWTLSGDAHFYPLAEIPLEARAGLSLVRCFLGATSQDVPMGFPHGFVTLFVVKQNRVFLGSFSLSQDTNATTVCDEDWKKSGSSDDDDRIGGLQELLSEEYFQSAILSRFGGKGPIPRGPPRGFQMTKSMRCRPEKRIRVDRDYSYSSLIP